ncbi:MAG: hypothetical protein WA061_06765 [Microgenomates group bacterium]
MEEKKDTHVPQTKSLYDSSYGEIFGKNFVAGFGKALGGLFVSVALYAVLGLLFIKMVLPTLEPFIASMTSFSKSLESFSRVKQGSAITIPNINFQKMLGQ